MNQPERMFVDLRTGVRYRARLTPREGTDPLGVDKRLNAVVFETPQGQWVGSVPVHPNVTLWTLAEEDLAVRLDQAVGRGRIPWWALDTALGIESSMSSVCSVLWSLMFSPMGPSVTSPSMGSSRSTSFGSPPKALQAVFRGRI